jgi:hypothetical protein
MTPAPPATIPTIASAAAVIGEAELGAMAAAIRAEIPGAEVRLFGWRARAEAIYWIFVRDLGVWLGALGMY